MVLLHRRFVTVLAALGLLVSGSLYTAQAATTPVPHRDGLPMAMMGQVVGTTFELPPPPAGQTPEQRAQWLVQERPMVGRTPASWLSLANEAFPLSVEPGGLVASSVGISLTNEVLRTYSLVGLTPPATEQASLDAQAAALSPLVRSELTRLVASVNDAYAAQAPVARRVAATFEAGFDPHTPLLSVVDRDATLARQQTIVAAVARFRAMALPVLLTGSATSLSTPPFSDSEGLIVLGGSGNDTYVQGGLILDPVLMVDPAGSDIYRNSAGGACPVNPTALGGTWLRCNSLVASVVADLGDGATTASNDQYLYNGDPTAVQGAGGPGGIGVLVDVAGNDRYDATMTRGAINPFPGLYYFDGGAQGYGYGGTGVLLDRTGDDYYRFAVKSTAGRSIWALGQGFGGAGGVGIAADSAGADQWITQGLGITGGTAGFQGVYTMGVGFYGGVGVITDTGAANDRYSATVTATTTDYYAQGFGAFGGLGIQVDDGGNDSYVATETATSSWIDPLLNCAFGTGSFAGVGIMLEGGGNDTYFGASTNRGAATIDDWGAGHPGMSYGLFVDSGGTDRYEMQAVSTSGAFTSTNGMGYWEPGIGDPVESPVGENTFGTFADLGGATDTYIGAPFAGNNSQWAFGLDR